jgi:hypothetical protein
MTAQNLKIAPAPASAARETLAAAIARKAECDKLAADADAASLRLNDAVWPHVNVVEKARQVVSETQAAAVARLVDADAPAPAMTLREARQALEDEEAMLADLRAARDNARAEPERMRQRLDFARMAVDEAIAAVIAGEPAVRALVERFRRQAVDVNTTQRALEFLSNRKALPPDLVRWRYCETAAPCDACETAWRATWEALTTDANAALSEEVGK